LLYLYVLCGILLLVAMGLTSLPLPLAKKAVPDLSQPRQSFLAVLVTPTAMVLAALFFLYTGVENAVGGWLASYAKRETIGGGTLWVTASSFFYLALLAGRAVAPAFLRRMREVTLARAGLSLALVGIALLLATHSMAGVLVSASIAGFGLAAVYPITIALMTRTVGRISTMARNVMFALAGLGAASVPWLVGFASTVEASLKLGLGVALAACTAMLLLYLRSWPEAAPLGSERPTSPAKLVH